MEKDKMKKEMKRNKAYLKKLRKQVDETDNKIIELLKKRFEISKKIGKYKKQNNLSIKNKKREKHLLEKNKNKAKRHNLKPKFVKKLFKLILKESKKIQE